MNKTVTIAGKEYGTVFLAPMAGMGDAAFRRICKEHGADYMTTEMVSAKALCYGDKKTPILAAIREYETPIAIQIFGSEPETMARASEILLEFAAKSGIAPAAIDVNMGCPAPKIAGNRCGSALMRDPDLCRRIVDFILSPTMLALGDENSLRALWYDLTNKDWFKALLDVERTAVEKI